MIERTFINKAMRNMNIDKYLNEELDRSDYAYCEIHRTPLNTRIIIYAGRPGMVIGRSGKKIDQITETLEKEFGIFKPHIEVRDVFNPDLNARLVAKYIVSGLERGIKHKKLVNTALSRVMNAGAIGIEIIISGKISGERSRVEKFKEGYIKKCGFSATNDVEKAKEMAVLKQGALGVQVSIMKSLPDIMLLEKEFAARKDEEKKEMVEEAKKEEKEKEQNNREEESKEKDADKSTDSKEEKEKETKKKSE